LSDISFVLKDSNIIGLLGPNGAGKTTLLRVITGIYTQTSGKILWNEKLVNTKSKKHKKRTFLLFKINNLEVAFLCSKGVVLLFYIRQIF
jgi:ABC-type multidrug transport system ATPase subunit